jgi:hypothetical protein
MLILTPKTFQFARHHWKSTGAVLLMLRQNFGHGELATLTSDDVAPLR